MRTVHLRVSDAITGEPAPCRLRVAGPAGEYFPPLGRSAEFSVNKAEDVGGNLFVANERWAVTSGACEIPVPDGVPLREILQTTANK